MIGERIRYNREYFGYLVAHPDGEIGLLAPSAQALLETSTATKEGLARHALTSFEVRDGFHLATPPLVWLELTRRCNLRCEHCYIDGGIARQNELPSERFVELVDEFAAMGVWAVAFTGGEPTLHRDFARLVSHARNRGLLVGIATNGMFLSERLLDSLPRDGVIVSISLDNLHAIKGRPEFDEVTAAILRCQDLGFDTNIMTNTNKANIRELGSLMDWAESHGVSVRSVPFSPLGRGKNARHLQNGPEDVEEAARFWLRECSFEHRYHRRVGLCVGAIFNYGLTMAFMTRRCSSGRYLAYVAADGTVFPCTMCAGEEILSPGSVRHRSFAELWRADWQIRNYSWDNFAATCAPCPINDAAYYCAARCPALSHARNGTLFGCGASEFEILSAIRRTSMLQTIEL